MLHSTVLRRKPFSNLSGFVVERPHPSAIHDVPGFIDDVQPLGPGGVGGLGGVAHVINAEGQRKLVARGEILGDGYALPESFRLHVANVIFHVGLHLPFVGGMRLADVNGEKIRVVLVVVVDLNDVAYLAAKRRSSEAAKHQYQRTRADAFANVKMIDAVKRQEANVGGIAPDL